MQLHSSEVRVQSPVLPRSEQTLLPVPLLWIYCFLANTSFVTIYVNVYKRAPIIITFTAAAVSQRAEFGGNLSKGPNSQAIIAKSHSDSTQIALSARCMQSTNSETMSGQTSGLMPSGGFDFLRDFDEVAAWSGDVLDVAQTHTLISLSAQHTNLPSTCNGSSNASLPSISAPQQECCKSTAAAERNRRAQKTFRQKQRVKHS